MATGLDSAKVVKPAIQVIYLLYYTVGHKNTPVFFVIISTILDRF